MSTSSPPGKPRHPYKEGNVDENGNYLVGKGRTPEATRFQAGDGRKRGRRVKRDKNLRADFEEEMAADVTVSVNGKPRKVSRQRAIVMRLADNASRGQSSAIQTVFKLQERFEGKQSPMERGETTESADITPANNELDLDRLTSQEFEELDRLLHKANGIAYQTPRKDPLAYLFDLNDERNYYTERTVDGLHYRHCKIPGLKSELLGMDNHAYRATALPKRQIFNRICN